MCVFLLMTFPPSAILILATCLVLPAVAITLAFVLLARSRIRSTLKTMTTTVRGLRADVKDLDLDARRGGWRREHWDGPTVHLETKMMNASHEVMLLSPYAEVSVPVQVEEGTQRRRCSLCLN